MGELRHASGFAQNLRLRVGNVDVAASALTAQRRLLQRLRHDLQRGRPSTPKTAGGRGAGGGAGRELAQATLPQ